MRNICKALMAAALLLVPSMAQAQTTVTDEHATPDDLFTCLAVAVAAVDNAGFSVISTSGDTVSGDSSDGQYTVDITCSDYNAEFVLSGPDPDTVHELLTSMESDYDSAVVTTT